MAKLWDKTAETSSPSELNPLTNPLLERNLGRWAQVYLSTPPAKREQALNTLLAELKREAGAGPEAEPVGSYVARDTKFQPTVCSICQRQNPPGHRFCSRCGQPIELTPEASKPGADDPAANNPGANNSGVRCDGIWRQAKCRAAAFSRSATVTRGKRRTVAPRPKVHRIGRVRDSAPQRMEVPAGRRHHWTGRFCICAMVPGNSGPRVHRCDAARECFRAKRKSNCASAASEHFSAAVAAEFTFS